jgi:uncharacterized protein YceK
MKLALKTILLVALACLMTGCGTLARNDFKYMLEESDLYPATKFDIFLVQGGPLAIPFILVDLPISLTTDTLLLPYDLATRKKN